MKLTKKQRDKLYDKYGGRCAYCGEPLPARWHADHLEPIKRNWESNTAMFPENHHEQNWNPSCPKCNINKHSMTIEQFRRSIAKYVESLTNYSVQYQMAKKYGLVTETGIEVKFYFETYKSQSNG